MTRQIAYPTPKADAFPSFMGRNGYFHSVALEITHLTCGLVALQPTTTKGVTGRCVIELPADITVLRQVALELNWIADKLQKGDEAASRKD